MPQVKILLEPGETQEQAEEILLKALKHKQSLDPEESFGDPAMTDMSHKLFKAHADMYPDMIAEINEALDAEYLDGGV